MSATMCISHAAPADQPGSVQQIADILFAAYTVDGGRVSLAGCSLEDRLLVHLGFCLGKERFDLYLNDEGQEVDGRPVVDVRPVPLVPLADPPRTLGPQIERLVAAGVRLAEERSGGPEPQLITAQAVWCKHVEGKLRFTIGAASIDHPFSGWTRTLVPPPVVCPHTGVPTFRLAATDDGRIAAQERIEPCAESGRRLLSSELVTCSVSGRRVDPELIEICPVTGRRLLKRLIVRCGMCRQRVSPAALERGHCAACRKLRRVDKADPRMARVLHEHPSLDRWRHWRISETARAYVLLASGWVRRLLVVVDKDTLEIRHMATGVRLLARWDAAEPAQFPYVLRE